MLLSDCILVSLLEMNREHVTQKVSSLYGSYKCELQKARVRVFG